MFSYVTPLTRGTKFEEKRKKSKYKAFWEKDEETTKDGVSSSTKKSKSTTRAKNADTDYGVAAEARAAVDSGANGDGGVEGAAHTASSKKPASVDSEPHPTGTKQKSTKGTRRRDPEMPAVASTTEHGSDRTAANAHTRATLLAEKEHLAARVQRVSEESAVGDEWGVERDTPTLPSLREYITEQRRRKVKNGGVLEFAVSISTNQNVEVVDYENGDSSQSVLSQPAPSPAEQPRGVAQPADGTTSVSSSSTDSAGPTGTTENTHAEAEVGDGTHVKSGDEGEALLTWEAVEKMGATIDQQHMEVLKGVLAERDEARTERNELLNKLVAVTDSYEELL